MATDNQIQYLERLISERIDTIDRIGIEAHRYALSTYTKAKYAHLTQDEQWEMWDRRSEDGNEILCAMRQYLTTLNPETASKDEASAMIDLLKSGQYIDRVISMTLSA